jgi:hypothetical protein
MRDETNQAREIRSTGWLLPRVMLFFFVLDLGLRFVPLGPLTFRAWEAMLRYYPNAIGPFVPNQHYHRDISYGGVASVGNLPALRHTHAADFTTDALGFHNPPALSSANPAGMVIGDSFAVGGELPEDESLSAQLTKRFGAYFYNAGATQPLHIQSLERVAQRIGLRRGYVIFEFLESRALQDPPAATLDGGRGEIQTAILRTLRPEWTDRLETPLNQLHASPLEAVSTKVEKRLQNDSLLPNSFARFVVQEKLRNGEPITFLPAEFQSPADPRTAADRWARYFSWYADSLRKDGLQLVVLLVPNRPTIYGPLLAHPRDESHSAATLAEIEAAARGVGVDVVSLEPRFSREAPAMLSENKYLYLLDDTHWSGTGTAIAADEVFRHVQH